MYPRIRRPFVTWLLTVVTGGLYLFFWVGRVATEINRAEERTVFPLVAWRNAFIALMGLTLAGFLAILRTDSPIVFLVVLPCLLTFHVYVQLSIGNYIKSKDTELATGEVFSNALSVFLFWLVANSGVAYMQAGINRIITHERARS